MMPLIWNVQNKQIYREKIDEWLPRAEGNERGVGLVMAKGCGVSCWGNLNILKLIVAMGTQFCEYAKSH